MTFFGSLFDVLTAHMQSVELPRVEMLKLGALRVRGWLRVYESVWGRGKSRHLLKCFRYQSMALRGQARFFDGPTTS